MDLFFFYFNKDLRNGSVFRDDDYFFNDLIEIMYFGGKNRVRE